MPDIVNQFETSTGDLVFISALSPGEEHAFVKPIAEVRAAADIAQFDLRKEMRDRQTSPLALQYLSDDLAQAVHSPYEKFFMAEMPVPEAHVTCLVGICWAIHEADDDTLLIANLAVNPHDQGKGIGTELLDTAISAYPDAQTISLGVLSCNRTFLWYESLGFRSLYEPDAAYIQGQAYEDAVTHLMQAPSDVVRENLRAAEPVNH
jgi:ribosomal protein S18 acetylase RimI-like enzyme